jgi:hypothetical protein
MSGPLRLPKNIDSLPPAYRNYAISTLELRQALLACNPKSKLHPLYRDFIDKPKPGHICYTSNSVANLNLPTVYIINNLSAYVKPGYSQEWVAEQINDIRSGKANQDGLHLSNALTPFGQRNLLGLWVALEGAVYSQLDERIHFVNEPPASWGKPIATWGGIDWGFQNPRLLIIKEYKDGRYLTWSYWAGSGIEPSVMINKMEELTNRFNVQAWYAPPDQPGLIKTAKKTIGSGAIKRAKSNVLPGIDAVARLINQGKLLFYNDGTKEARLFWGELTNYQWKQNRDGDYLDEPIKEADHFPDSLRYTLYTRHFRDSVKEKEEPERPIGARGTLLKNNVDKLVSRLTY